MTDINHRIVQRLYDPLFGSMQNAIRRWYNHHQGVFTDPVSDYSFVCVVDSVGEHLKIVEDPIYHPGSTRIQLGVLREGADASTFDGDLRHVAFRFDVPTLLLREKGKPQKYTLYHVRFMVDSSWIDEISSEPLRRGYIGITGRNPFVRLGEHRRDAMRGAGHLLHKTWRSLEETGHVYVPVFQINAFADTLGEIYEKEELAVEKTTLAPKGLNVIPGGYAGIRMLHQLRLVDGEDRQVGVDDRDAALARLEGRQAPGSPCTHYRSGHIRKISETRSTWVRACWVNLKAAELV